MKRSLFEQDKSRKKNSVYVDKKKNSGMCVKCRTTNSRVLELLFRKNKQKIPRTIYINIIKKKQPKQEWHEKK